MKRYKLELIKLSVLYCLYFLVYLTVYSNYITKTYGYMGFTNSLVVSSIPLAIVAIIICTLLAGIAATPSVFFLHVALGTIVVPSMVLYCGSNLPIEFYLTSFLAFAVIAFTSKIIDVKRPKLNEINNLKILKILAVTAVGTILAIVLLGGGRFLNFDLTAVYEVRGDAAKNLPGLFGYLNSAVGKVIVPFGIVIAVLTRKWVYVLVLFFVAILLFGLTAHKAILFNPFVVLFFYYITGKEKAIQYFIISLIIIGIVSASEFYFSDAIRGNYWVSDLLVRRTLLVPSLLNWFYIDWFSNNDQFFWADSKISFGLVDSPNALRSVNLIGLQYFERDEMAANTGWIGSGYANAGIIGVFIYSIAIGLLLAALNSYAKKLGMRLVISLFVISLLGIITSTDIVTSLLTHGLLVALLLVSVMVPIRHSDILSK